MTNSPGSRVVLEVTVKSEAEMHELEALTESLSDGARRPRI